MLEVQGKSLSFQPLLAPRPFLVLSLFLASCGGNGLSKSQTPQSQVLIRGGSLVKENETGPQRLSTVALIGQSRQGQFTCSAVLVKRQILITAAHCADSPARISAAFSTKLRGLIANDVIPVIRKAVHPDYVSNSDGQGLPPHDVAVLKLAEPAPERFQATPLLTDERIVQNPTEALIAGYGITESGDDSGTLRSTLAQFTGIDSLGRLKIEDTLRRGACSGDSGGPLFLESNGTFFAAGVLSGGPIPCRGINLYTSLVGEKNFLDSVLKSPEFASE